jgi:SNF2 family DNA or RNA helicase
MMLSDGGIDITVEAEFPPILRITRQEDTNDAFWSRLCIELGSGAQIGAPWIDVRLEAFLTHRPLLRALTRQYNVPLRASDPAAAMLSVANEREESLREVLGGQVPLENRLATLAQSRFSRQLKPFQERDTTKLLGLPNGANFSVPGAGKTVVAFATYEVERLRQRVSRLLVVAPLSAFDAWETEARDSFHEPLALEAFDVGRPIAIGTEVLLVNYQKLPGHFDRLAAWAQSSPTHMILDEAHRIKKGRAGAWGNAALNLAWYGARRDILTGTPAPQHPSDLEALLDFSWPSQGRGLLPQAAFDRMPPRDIGARISGAIGPLFVRTRKSELGLDEPRMRVIQLELQGLQRDVYSAVTNQYAGQLRLHRRDRYALARMRSVVMYLLEAATNPALLPVGSSSDDPPAFQHPPAEIGEEADLGSLLAEYATYEIPAKFRKLGELVKENADEGRKTLVWSNFVRNLELLKSEFRRYQPAMIHGGVSSELTDPNASPSREAEIERFRTDPDCLLLLANPAAMSEGLSLHHACHDAIYLERTFNAGQYLQSVDRIHRLGLAPGVETRITFLVTKDTIDEVVYARIHEKAKRLGDMLNDADIVTMALPDEEDLEEVEEGLGQPIDALEDVEALFRHLREVSNGAQA